MMAGRRLAKVRCHLPWPVVLDSSHTDSFLPCSATGTIKGIQYSTLHQPCRSLFLISGSYRPITGVNVDIEA